MLFNMVLKTFNLEDETYRKFSEFCRENGLSMSKQVDIFIKAQIEESPKVREDYLKKLEAIRKGRFINVGTFEDFEKLKKKI
ncbi:hypothetical protein CMI42_01295 [Candidatus Pacearchaeota archaeon]|nr:hypothetical protein [Candidatus Pacearchaeota archaeon]